ncbi:MAG: hypothetical protein GEU93_02310 [Propionibacteriales bacterium]|nr:hypothetical protein [Propionibacteriales bacterium]
MTRPVAPAGWPQAVLPAGAPGWEESAVSWLLDISPPELRGYAVLRRHPVALVRFAVVHTDAFREGALRALPQARTTLSDYVQPDVIEEFVAAWEHEIVRLVARRRAVGLVEEALRRRYAPRD